MNHPFQAGGALLADSTVYIERKADSEALAHLRNMAYLLVIEPRQQGKTSLINHLMCHPALGDVAFAYVDVTTPDRSTEAAWYQTLCPRTLRQLRGFIPRDQWPTIPQNSAGWREFLCDVAMLATDARRLVVVALDEIGAVTFPGATEFFSVLRDVYNSRQAEMEFKQLTFLLAGAFHPRDLIKDDKISPFNIAQRVRLADFTLAQARELVGKGSWTDEQATVLAERIHHWTDGQPYLTQLLCSYLGPNATPADVDTNVERLRREDENHLPPMLERLNRDEKLCRYVDRILAGECIKFYPRENRRQAQLELLGVIKEGTEGFCVVRNRIYERVLTGTAGSRDESTSRMVSPFPDTKRISSLRINADFDEVWRCLVYTRDLEKQDGAYWATQKRLWWSVTEQAHGLTTKSATLLLGINRPDADSIYDFNERRLRLLEGAQGWTVIEVYADLVAESQSDPEATRIFDDFSDSFERMFRRLGYEVTKETYESAQTESVVHSVREPVSHPELNDALTRRTLALFIGADLPCEVTGLPSRADLARELARRKGLDETLSLAEVAQRVSQAGNRWEFTAFIRDALDTAGKSPQPFHRRIVELVRTHHIEALITTAYDNLLELAFQEAGVGINRVVRGSDVNFINPDRSTLIKLYGDAQQPDTLVVTDRDHSDLLRDRDKEPLVDEVRRVFRRNIVLFLGYNLADPDFRFLFDQIAESSFARTAYAVWPGLPEADVRMWRDRGITIVDVNLLGVLTGLSAEPEPLASSIPLSGDYAAGSSESPAASHASHRVHLPIVGELIYDFVENFAKASITAQMADPQYGAQVWDQCGCGGEIKKAIFAHPHPLHGCKFRYTVQDFAATIKRVCLDFFIGIHDKPSFAADDSICFEIHINGEKRWSKQWSKKQWNRNRIGGIKVGPGRTLEVMFVTDDLGRNECNWAVWGSPALIVEELQIEQVPDIRQKVAHVSRGTVSPIGGKDMDYEHGLDVLKQFAEGTDWHDDFDLYEAQLGENLRDERRYGPSEQSRRDRARIVDHLNALVREHLDISFNDLCMGKLPRVERLDEAADEDITALIQELKALVIEANAADREASERLWQAVQQGRVEQGEIAATVDALRRWARSIQRTGLPPDEDLRTAILTLTQPAEGVDGMYNYLHFALPLLPGLLSIQSEIDLNKLWAGVKERWGQKPAKGDGEAPATTEIYGTGKRWAVLIGVNEYVDKANYGRLHVCVKDVHAIREQFIAGGFEPARIRLLADGTSELPTRDNILVALKAVADATEADDLLLFYYSGHGDKDEGESYLVARNGRRLVLSDTAVRVSRVKEIMEQAPARAKVIVLDACHSGADIGGKGPKPMSSEFIRRVFEQAEGLAILASCKQGQVSYEWRAQERSVFTHFLLEALEGQADRDEKDLITVQDTNRHVTNGVKLWASQHNVSQTPTLQTAIAGDIILVRHQ